MAFFNARHERERRERETSDHILQIARAKGQFTVSLRYRDDWLRERCSKLRRAGLLTGGKRHGSQIIYYPAAVRSAPSVNSLSGPANSAPDLSGDHAQGIAK